MRWPWQKPEIRESGGAYGDAVLRLLQSQAAGSSADAGSTAAVEAASGALSRAFASARVEGPPHVREAVTPLFLAQVGRDLIRSGRSLHVVHVDLAGHVSLIPSSTWYFDGGSDPRSWWLRVTIFGPSSTETVDVPFSGVVFVKWGARPERPYDGVGPLAWAHLTGRLQAETERSPWPMRYRVRSRSCFPCRRTAGMPKKATR